MKIFISWSGPRSQAVAELLKDWIKILLQATEPWISSKDIDRGSIWFSEIHGQLGESAVGIVCLTPENKDKPWILFESGAIAKGIQTSRVCTILLDLEPSAIDPPLAQFNHTRADREDMLKLVKDINKWLGDRGLPDALVERTFNTNWPDFESGIAKAKGLLPKQAEPKRSNESLLDEILQNTRSLTAQVSKLTHDTSANGPVSNEMLRQALFESRRWAVGPKGTDQTALGRAASQILAYILDEEAGLGRPMTSEELRTSLTYVANQKPSSA